MHTIDIAEGWHRPAGAPSIWVDGDLQEAANHWLWWDVMASSGSTHTWRAAAQSISHWLDWCAVQDADWRYASRDLLIAWRDAQLGAVSPHTGQPYSPETVRIRMIYVFQYYDHAQHHGWCDSDIPNNRPSPHPRPSTDDPLLHLRKGKGSTPTGTPRKKLLPKPQNTDVVDVLSRHEIEALFSQLGPRPSKRNVSDPGNARDWLLIAIPMFAGLRKSELLNLSVHQFQTIVADPDAPLLSYDIKITGKGNKERAVSFYGWLIQEVHAYIEGERRRAARRQRRAPSPLFLSRENHPRAGRPIGEGAVNDVVERAMRMAGLVKHKPVYDPVACRQDTRTVTQYSMHSLRHTYAVHAYHLLKQAGEHDPWKRIQMQLGHASPKTTLDTYLKYVTLFGESQSEIDLRDLLNG